MAKEFAKKFYNSAKWQRCRAAYIKSVNGLCERCLAKGKIVPGYIVHHKEQLTPDNINNPEITLCFDYLEYTCKICHDEEHGVCVAQPAVREGIGFDEHGQLVEITPPKIARGAIFSKTGWVH